MIEEVIKEHTAAIKEQTAVLQKLVTVLAVQSAATVKTEVKTTFAEAEVKGKDPEPVAKKATTKKAEKSVAEKTELDLMEEVIAEEDDPLGDFEEIAESVLPAGERDEAFYTKHVQPLCLELVSKNKPAFAKIVLEHFKVKNAKLLPPEQWDELVTMVKAEL